jgi:hypothetical protein
VKSDSKGEYVTVKAISTEPKLDDNDFYAEGYEEDDYVVFTVDYNEDEDFYICELMAPETVNGEVTRVEKDKDRRDLSEAGRWCQVQLLRRRPHRL